MGLTPSVILVPRQAIQTPIHTPPALRATPSHDVRGKGESAQQSGNFRCFASPVFPRTSCEGVAGHPAEGVFNHEWRRGKMDSLL